MSYLTEQIETSIVEKELFRDGQRILLAVSGGVDSMVLLDFLRRMAKARRWKLTVAHFNHQLRGAVSDEDEKLVRNTSRKLKLPFVAGRGDVGEFARKCGLSVEMAARKMRHDFLAKTAAKLKIPTVALAHHADDQVELFFLRLFRGAGGEGLAGMKWSNDSPSDPTIRLARPLLDVSKTTLHNFAEENKIAFSEDASNASVDIQRNYIRHELIPLLTRQCQPALNRSILRVMEVIGAEAEFVARAAREWLQGSRMPDFAHLPVAVQRRLVYQQLTEHKLSPDFDLVERLRLNACQWIAVSADRSVFRNESGVVEVREPALLQFGAQRLELCLLAAKREITFGGLKISWQFADAKGVVELDNHENQGEAECFDADKVGTPICLRHWQPGDRFQPIGARSASKLQDLFTNLKVPAAERRRRVVAATRQGELFWVEGLRMAEKFKLDGSTVRTLNWSWHRYMGLVLS